MFTPRWIAFEAKLPHLFGQGISSVRSCLTSLLSRVVWESSNRKGVLVCQAKDFGSEVAFIKRVVLGIEDQFGGY